MPPKKKQKLEKPTCLHTCNKTSFAKAFLPNYHQRLLDYIAIIHQLADHASHALKFYILSAPSFTVNEETIEAILYLLNKGEAWHPRKEAKKAWRDCLLPYVQRYCQIVGFVHPNLRGEQQSVNYLTASMMTNLKVNIQEHCMTMLLRYINLRLDVKGRKGQLPPKSDARKAFFTRLRYLKSVFLFDIVPESLDDLTAEESELLEEIWTLNLPFPDQDKPLAYLIAIDAMSFFPAYCRLSSLYEKHGFRRFSAIPLRRSLIQSNIRIDSKILYQHILCITQREAEAVEKVDLWLRVCNLRTKAFRSRCGMHFEGSITTDGTSVSVYLKHPEADKYGKRSGGKKSANMMEAEVKVQYVEKNLPACRAAENIVVIDPNKRDILYCQDSNGTTFRYTANQRAMETGSRRFAKRREAMKKKAGIDLIESRIPSHKTMNLMDFTRYLLVRRADWDRRKYFYSHPAHTRWKWHAFINRQKSESNLISNLRNKYGENFTIVMGDWSDAGQTARFQTSSKTKGWRTLFTTALIVFFLMNTRPHLFALAVHPLSLLRKASKNDLIQDLGGDMKARLKKSMDCWVVPTLTVCSKPG
ncbi:hypothetical protein, variant 1 [Spizellomyces punctatus DAOM BR117]|uniref:Uncharacterized protein n=1 Tax=Spizellomyces punctatus (strain DAOM BR117) TaxID=645134 RepID=A0A0L0HKS1_SPIPD|nr:hypothetical protein, variant 1 [Spizellomyces punctatus DAOM BR117]KND01623.1 hypothetical protein, variant 1 [Spizellomyces punctatus DAOM BR117]|eukprot:XP_016609662.1 hypothetical protein, variant 1 [Spizellomyces punctatus DAOM BR117]